jgi:hypothetical protein
MVSISSLDSEKKIVISLSKPVSIFLVNLTDSDYGIKYASFPHEPIYRENIFNFPSFVFSVIHSFMFIALFIMAHGICQTQCYSLHRFFYLILWDEYWYYVQVQLGQVWIKKNKPLFVLVNWAGIWAQVWHPTPQSQPLGTLIYSARHFVKYWPK